MPTPTVVADIMTRDVLFLKEEDNLVDISKGMERFSLRHLPVVDGSRLIGLITHRDVLRLALSELVDDPAVRQARQRRLNENTFVAKVMTRDPLTVAPQTPIVDAVQMMVRSKFGCLPVVEEGNKLVGIVTEHDFMKLLVTLMKHDS